MGVSFKSVNRALVALKCDKSYWAVLFDHVALVFVQFIDCNAKFWISFHWRTPLLSVRVNRLSNIYKTSNQTQMLTYKCHELVLSFHTMRLVFDLLKSTKLVIFKQTTEDKATFSYQVVFDGTKATPTPTFRVSAILTKNKGTYSIFVSKLGHWRKQQISPYTNRRYVVLLSNIFAETQGSASITGFSPFCGGWCKLIWTKAAQFGNCL